jgi:transcriptional regulator GlxA family with amidase domain
MSVSTDGVIPDATAGKSSPSHTVPENAASRPRNGIASIQEKRLQKVLDMIESQPSRSVRELAQEVNLSPARLQRLFKHETGVDVSEALTERRLQRAAQLLAASDMQIKEIAYIVGYEHASSFVRAFHRRFALAPRLYRRQEGVAEC